MRRVTHVTAKHATAFAAFGGGKAMRRVTHVAAQHATAFAAFALALPSVVATAASESTSKESVPSVDTFSAAVNCGMTLGPAVEAADSTGPLLKGRAVNMPQLAAGHTSALAHIWCRDAMLGAVGALMTDAPAAIADEHAPTIGALATPVTSL